MMNPSAANSAPVWPPARRQSLARTTNPYAPSGMHNNVAQIPGPGPAHKLAATTAPKKKNERCARSSHRLEQDLEPERRAHQRHGQAVSKEETPLHRSA